MPDPNEREPDPFEPYAWDEPIGFEPGYRDERMDHTIFNDPRYCSICDGELSYLETLGKTKHFRCRLCGANQNTEGN